MLRTLLVVLAALLPALLTGPAARAATACDAPAVERFGPASVTGAIVGAAVLDGHAYVVTRGLKPPVLADIDLATREVVRSVTLPDGPAAGEPEGGWATAVSGGKVYVGTYPVPDLYSFDPATGAVEHLRSFGKNGGFVWSLAAAPDGTLYAGTYPDGRVREYVPATGEVRDFGVLAQGERYVRAVAADDTYVYAGLLDKAKLVRITRADGTVKELASAATGIGAIAEHGDRVLAASGGALIDMRKDGTDEHRVSLASGSIDMLTVAGDGTVYATSRPDGAVHRYRTGDTAFTKIADPPSPADETRRLHLADDHTLLGFAGSGGVWSLDLGTGRSTFTDLIEAGLPGGPERPQSMLLVNNRAVYVGGHFSMEVRDLRTGERRRFHMPGEPKDLVRRGDKIYAAIYPSGQIVSVDLRTDEVRGVGTLGHGQQRPWDIEYDRVTDKLVVASAPLGAALEGALSVVDPDTGRIDVYEGVIPHQSLMSLSLDPRGGVVYLGGDVLGGGGTPPVAASASVAAFDLRARTVLWQVDPVPGFRTFQDIKVHDGLLYGVYKRDSGSWIAMDLATKTVVRQGKLSGYGELTVHRGRVFVSTFFGGGNAYELGEEAKLLATGLGDEWYTNPQLHFEPGSWRAWALVGRDLARIRLDPRCPPLTVTP
ncbi:PQQ-binding-like beta-propeller repeat protein [Nonomuraea phyllanthi]|uniref:PQQ-binding-like beta-propeller repeat protein n=1 Tax=Nonomuraea phyllanthi TaxID=2219224 RepID=A0A5C4W711_9ACTN|nr:PQQ-binding-like beta-propeller repeat protein [Nonomuraea phyllanthi]KAB8192316.1 PQQ-binding-like beta-propeller repeat protein [Nonomuraea phyllanthi]QFY11329.1 PQQ-binding-like beta-propeller repeat protein [Nonomuraea phyllanthi]